MADSEAMKYCEMLIGAFCALALPACSKENPTVPEVSASTVSVKDVAVLLSTLPIGVEQMEEVFDAASASAQNGYDEEYRMQDLFAAPGQGVGDQGVTKAREYAHPLRELFSEAVFRTKADGGTEATAAYIDALSLSDVQIYWPFSKEWDGKSLPVITFDPGDEVSTRNVGYALKADGRVEKLMVDEALARERPVWVVNRNSDAEYKSLELLRREDPDWGHGGGDIVVTGKTKADTGIRTLILRSFKAKRQFDTWFAGAAEFFVKMGSVDDFSGGMTEAEMRIFEPSITDFMIVVRRNQLGEAIPFNAVMVSEWTNELVSSAFMIVEDDGGTRTTWKASAVVKYNSKSYGVDVEFPINTRDDIVWRGSLSRNYIEKYDGRACNYGDVELVLEFI